MKQFGNILKFELKSYLQNKAFVGVTIVLVVILALAMFIPRIMSSMDEDTDTVEELPVMLIKSENNTNAEAIKQTFAQSFVGYNIQLTDESVDNIKTKITSGEVECAFVLKGETEYTYYVNNLSLYDSNSAVADEVLRELHRINLLMNSGMTFEQVGEVMNVQINGTVESLGKDQMQNFFYTYIMIFALYMVILLYGQMVSMNVATEKSSRAMEVLITSAKPTSMMFGKVIASCLAGLTQLAVIFGSAIGFYTLNKSYFGENVIIDSIFNIPPELLVYMLVFFLLGFLIYAFLYGAVSSTVSKLEDINSAVQPITFLFVAGFIVVVMAMSSGDVDTVLMKVCSFIPFTSPMAMFTRIAMSTVPAAEIVISIVVLALSAVGIGLLSAKIYRMGVLLYGNKLKFGAIIKAAFKK